MKTTFVAEQDVHLQTILIIDQDDVVGSKLIRSVQKYDESLQAIFVTANPNGTLEKTTIVSFKKNTAFIPDASYVHIFIVYQKEKSLQGLLSKILEKAEHDRSRVVVAVHLSLLSDPMLSQLGSYSHISLVVYGDLFGDQNLKEGVINTLLRQAKTSGRVIVSGSGLNKAYITHVDDLVKALLGGALSTKKQTIILTYPKHPPTVLRVAHEIQRSEPEIKIDFGKEEANIEPPRIEGEYLYDRYPLRERIVQAMKTIAFSKHPSQAFPTTSKKRVIYPQSIIFFLMFVVFLPFLIAVSGGVVGGLLLKASIDQVERGSFASAQKIIGVSRVVVTIGTSAGGVAGAELSWVGKEHSLQAFNSALAIEKEMVDAGAYVSDAAEKYHNILSDVSRSPDGDMADVINDTKNAVAVYQKLRAENNFSQLQSLVGFLPLGFSVNKTMNTLDYFISTSSPLLDSLPELLGFGQKRSYLLLFQNNMELRPGGGFIGSYGIATLSNGKLTDFSVKDVYDADGQLKGHVEPPFAVRRYLSSVHLYLRDSNFDPDFSKSASSAAFLLAQETGQLVDGVVAIDVTFLQNMLKATGPVYVSDYNQTVTTDNVFMLTESHAEKNTFAGSSQKKDFLRSLATALELKLTSRDHISEMDVLDAIQTSMQQKHLLFAFADSGVQNIASISNLSSSIWDDRENDSATINDFVGINEANLGVNKANYFVKRKVNQQVSVDENGVVHSTIEIKYINESKEWPGGDYKNYLRVILPAGAQLTGVTLDGEDQTIIPAVTDPFVYEAKSFKTPKGLEVETTQEGDKVVYGFLMTVPADGQVKTVAISYIHPHKVAYDLPVFNYDVKLFKQPGTDASPYTLTFFYPDAFKPTSKPSDAIDSGQSITISSDTSTDRRFRLEFGKK